MGIFNGLIKKEAPPIIDDGSKKKLTLRKETLEDVVSKNPPSNMEARVVFVLDKSDSMQQEYTSGRVQELLERVFPMAMVFDDNQKMEFYLFNNNFVQLKAVTLSNIKSYVQNVILGKHEIMGGTNYSPVMKKITSVYGKLFKSKTPTFVIFITDGDNFDRYEAEKAIVDASQYNIFWKFIGIGSGGFDFLKHLDNISGRVVDNANFVEINDIAKISDKELYEKLLDEYSDWQNACKKAGIPV